MVIAEQYSPELFDMARNADARIYKGPCLRPPYSVWLHRAEQESLPWQEALVRAAIGLSDAELETILRKLGLHDKARWAAFRELIPAQSLPRFQALLKHGWAQSQACIGSTYVVETPEAWLNARTGEVLSDITIRVRYAVRCIVNSTTHISYSGIAIYKGQKFRWVLPFSQRPHLAARLERQIITAGVGIPRISSQWRKKLIDLALGFSSPRIKTVRIKSTDQQLPPAYSMPAQRRTLATTL